MEEINRFGGKHSFSMLWRFNPEWYGLIGSRCLKCGTVHYPRKLLCVYPCDGHEMQDVALSHMGVIRAAGLTPRSTDGYIDVQPLIIATIKLDDGPHLAGEIVNLSLDLTRKLALDRKEWARLTGKRVIMVIRKFRKHDNGDITYGHKFELTEAV